MTERHTGGCLCGAVRYSIGAKPGPVVGCHCSQCRRQTGFYYAAVNVPRTALSVEDAGAIRADPGPIEPSDRQRRVILERERFRLIVDPEAQVLFL